MTTPTPTDAAQPDPLANAIARAYRTADNHTRPATRRATGCGCDHGWITTHPAAIPAGTDPDTGTERWIRATTTVKRCPACNPEPQPDDPEPF